MKYYITILEVLNGFDNACEKSDFIEFEDLDKALDYIFISTNRGALEDNQRYCIFNESFEEVKTIYQVEQGVISPSGNGDLTHIKHFDNEEEARAYFSQIKDDKKDWVIPKGHVLVTEINASKINSDFYEMREMYECK